MEAALRKVASPCDLMLRRDHSHININLVQTDDPLRLSICEFVNCGAITWSGSSGRL